MSREISLSTMGRCFLCLQPSTHNGKQQDEGRLFSLQSLCRHLEISVDKIVASAPRKRGPGGGHGDMFADVPLCGRCGQSYLKFMDFFHTKELIEMELEHLLRSMKGWMVGRTEKELREFQRLMAVGAQSRDGEQLKIVEELRKTIIQKSALKLLQTKPTVKLNKPKMKKRSFSQDMSFSTFLPLDADTAPPALEDLRKCNAKLVPANDHYDDDNDDIPVPMLEIVKLEQPDDAGIEPRPSQHDGHREAELVVEIEANTDPGGPESRDIITGRGVPIRMETDKDTDPVWEPDLPSNDMNSEDDDDEIWEPRKNCRSTKSNRATSKRRLPASQKNKFIRLSGGKVRCKLCHRTFTKIPGWRIHYDSVHLGRRFKCDICSSSFAHRAAMTNHRKICDGRRRTPSPIPVASSSGVVLRDKARAYHGPIGVFTKYYFENEAGKFVCSLCQKEYAASSGFYAHFRVSHINIRRQCKDCGKTFTQNCTLTKHKETCLGKAKPAPELKYLCKVCGKGFSKPNWLVEHKERVHLGIKHTCNVCLKSYSYKHCLQRHACTGPPPGTSPSAPNEPTSTPSQQPPADGEGSNEDSIDGLNSTTAPEPLNRFDCKFCGKTFPSYVHYRAHSRKTFMKVQQRCMVCLTTFFHDCGLKLHNLGKCEGEARPLDQESKNIFECLECGNKFTSKGGLVMHRVSVHQGAVFRCDLCNKPFTNMSNVRRHRLTCLSHPSSKTGIAPLHPDQEPFKPRRRMRKADGTYECEHCQEKFDSAPKLNFHMDNVHLGLKFECGKCKKTFSRKTGLRLHRTRHCPYRKTEVSSSKGKRDGIEEPTGSYASYCHKGKRNGEVVCNLCKRSFASKVGFRIHYQSIHQGILHQYRCQICSKTFTKKADLGEHEKEDMCSGTVGELEDDDDGQQ